MSSWYPLQRQAVRMKGDVAHNVQYTFLKGGEGNYYRFCGDQE